MSSLMGGLVWLLNNNKKYDHKVKAHHCGCTANLCRNMWAYRDIRIYPQGLKNFREKVKRLPRRDRDTNQPKRGNFQPFSPQQHGGSLPQFPYQSHFLCVFFPPFMLLSQIFYFFGATLREPVSSPSFDLELPSLFVCFCIFHWDLTCWWVLINSRSLTSTRGYFSSFLHYGPCLWLDSPLTRNDYNLNQQCSQAWSSNTMRHLWVYLALPPIHCLLVEFFTDVKVDLGGAHAGRGFDVELLPVLTDFHVWVWGGRHSHLPQHGVHPWAAQRRKETEQSASYAHTDYIHYIQNVMKPRVNVILSSERMPRMLAVSLNFPSWFTHMDTEDESRLHQEWRVFFLKKWDNTVDPWLISVSS